MIANFVFKFCFTKIKNKIKTTSSVLVFETIIKTLFHKISSQK